MSNPVLNKQKELQKQFEQITNKNSVIGYDLNQDLLLISLYSLIPPLRQEIMTLKFSKKLERNDNWIVIKPDDIIMDLNEIKKKHNAIGMCDNVLCGFQYNKFVPYSSYS